MDTCPYYHEEVRPGRTGQVAIPCCAHKHSPSPCLSPSLLTETPYVLKCDGRLGKCQVPAHEQLDIA